MSSGFGRIEGEMSDVGRVVEKDVLLTKFLRRVDVKIVPARFSFVPSTPKLSSFTYPRLLYPLLKNGSRGL